MDGIDTSSAPVADEVKSEDAIKFDQPLAVSSMDMIKIEKCSNKRDTTNDVLYAKGAAAQTMSNPGNLYFYTLCESRYEEYAALHASDLKRRIITGEIVSAVSASGGKFRTIRGGKMKYQAAIEKTRDRLRQIGKPKLRPTGFGKNDVVSAKGAAVHLYPGNAKWHALLDEYVLSYYRDLVDASTGEILDDHLLIAAAQFKAVYKSRQKKKNGTFSKGGVELRPSYQVDIVNETIKVIHDREGKFRNEKMRELSHDSIEAKTHSRFKDLKKDLIAGKRKFVIKNNRSDNVLVKSEEGTQEDGAVGSAESIRSAIVEEKKYAVAAAFATNNNDTPVLPGTKIFRSRLGGFTAVRNIAPTRNELKTLIEKNRRLRPKKEKNASKMTSSRHKTEYSDDEDDGDSFHSAMLESDNNLNDCDDDIDEEGPLVDNETEDDTLSDGMNDDVLAKQAAKKNEKQAREERMKRRRSGIPIESQPIQKKLKKRRQSTEDSITPPSLEHPLSEYELYRLEKIKKNQAKLAELGLATSKRKRSTRKR
mmetsp:Transcript_41990/g.50382  ORF Transcript_41990/g.50382 Transcript_41990/m.50382 type:complete len:535 (-) Transcript_41990:2278-3882(-)|eukprot:CAMPEP_0194373004 /NCGR_PEP_ID=MMETSP0174-20130528/21433_1 /TAXON_ID=216777 /ORGANISM="Proboscia alata, Strain PI-D3" /LENGTH=534 /DNA_ID=CAMNT_0039151849 /DNA_START=160 /DNA_END=1764 /DNA_ORIENTATION=-